jgi:hypothetical protein
LLHWFPSCPFSILNPGFSQDRDAKSHYYALLGLRRGNARESRKVPLFLRILAEDETKAGEIVAADPVIMIGKSV